MGYSSQKLKCYPTDINGSVLLGEVCNLAAYTFAPATLVTPLGALSVVVGAILGSYILEETLGKVGRLGVMSCLVGAVLVVLHAPPDKPFESVDQVLRYAIRPGMSCSNPKRRELVLAETARRVSHLFPCHRHTRNALDSQGISSLWKTQRPSIHYDMLPYGIHIHNVRQGFRNSSTADIYWQEPVCLCLHLCLLSPCCDRPCLTNELFQQGSSGFPFKYVSQTLVK